MSSLLLPKRYAGAAKADLAARRAGSVADVIGRRAPTLTALDTDDFLSPLAVSDQLVQLQEFILAKREADHLYKLPRPLGWKLQVLLLTLPEVSDGGVHLVDEAREARSLASPQGVVIQVGPLCYKDPSRFGADSTPWCRVGDRITVVKYDAHIYKLGNGQNLGTLNDTQPVMVIDEGWGVPDYNPRAHDEEGEA